MSGLIIKLTGSILIMVSGLVFSRNLTGRLKSDIKFADGMIAGFISLEEYICGMLIPAEEALRFASKDAGEASEVFMSASCGNGNMRERFSKALEGYNKYYFDAVAGFAGGLSASDEKERRAAFSLIRTRLGNIREEAKQEYTRLGRLYNGAGILGGLVIVILLF